ncbi:MAG TPA: aldose epimerase family protein [bacterium]|nr:aldose epimerase family protein [bacterium]HPN32993.1 aldose epimerase family protein [bacterium]
MDLHQLVFGRLGDGREVQHFILSNNNGVTAQITNYGGILIALNMPDRTGRIDNVCLGFDDLHGYLGNHPYFGALVGRCANRIAHGSFEIDGRRYQLACNEKGITHLHGGVLGFDKKLWDAEPFLSQAHAGVKLSGLSPDGEEGYPGNLQVVVTYTLNEKNELLIEYQATTDWATPINLTNHAYWNFAGAGRSTIHDHELTLKCPSYLPVDENLLPTGKIASVFDTPFDFTAPKRIGQDIDAVGGYDHCFVIARAHTGLVLAARVVDPASGRGMEVWTTKPGVQLYTGNFLDNLQGAGGAVYQKQSALCLETQFFPDSLHHRSFPSCLLYPGKIYRHATVHKFFIEP